MNSTAAYIRRVLRACYPPEEAAWLARIVCCDLLGESMAGYCVGKDMILSANQEQMLQSILSRLLRFEPIQYIEGTARFCGRAFQVSPCVLVPRPETEELAELVLDGLPAGIRVLDVGTGSGCIAVTLSAERPAAEVEAWDISAEALQVARANNASLGGRVTFRQRDALNYRPKAEELETFDAIVSNPPYVTESERRGMARNVLDWEPALALFVPDNDPLRFYRAIALLGRSLLKAGGKLYFEINRRFGGETASMLEAMGYGNAIVQKDLSGNDRFVIAERWQE